MSPKFKFNIESNLIIKNYINNLKQTNNINETDKVQSINNNLKQTNNINEIDKVPSIFDYVIELNNITYDKKPTSMRGAILMFFDNELQSIDFSKLTDETRPRIDKQPLSKYLNWKLVKFAIYKIVIDPVTNKPVFIIAIDFNNPVNYSTIFNKFDKLVHIVKRDSFIESVDFVNKFENSVKGPWVFGEHKSYNKLIIKT